MVSNVPYRLRAADLEADRLGPELTRLWRESLGIAGDLEARLNWAYRHNPVGPGTLLLLDWQPDTGAPRTVGCLGLVRRSFGHRGAIRQGAMFGQFAVDPEHRTVQPALLLQRAAADFVGDQADFGYCFPNPAAIGVHRRVGHLQVGSVARYSKVLNFAHHLKGSRSPLRWARFVGQALDFLAPMPAMVRRSADRRRFAWLDQADERFDDLWKTAAGRVEFLGDRRREALTWRLRHAPGDRCRIGILTDPASRLLGYAAVERTDGGFAEIKDFLARDDASLATLLDRLAMAMADEGCVSLSVRFLGPPATVRVLQSRGFVQRADVRPFLVLPGRFGGLPLDPASWHVTDYDEDW